MLLPMVWLLGKSTSTSVHYLIWKGHRAMPMQPIWGDSFNKWQESYEERLALEPFVAP